jgi:hypothetical protein
MANTPALAVPVDPSIAGGSTAPASLRHRVRNPTIVDSSLRRTLKGRTPTSVGRTILGKAPKRGNRYLRVLVVQAYWLVLAKSLSWERHGLKAWIAAAQADAMMFGRSRCRTGSPVT